MRQYGKIYEMNREWQHTKKKPVEHKNAYNRNKRKKIQQIK